MGLYIAYFVFVMSCPWFGYKMADNKTYIG